MVVVSKKGGEVSTCEPILFRPISIFVVDNKDMGMVVKGPLGFLVIVGFI